MRANSSTIGELQERSLEDKVKIYTSVADLSVFGYDRFDKNTFVKENFKAHVNRVLLWIMSKEDDYVRSSFKGGVLYSLIGQLSSETNMQRWESIIRDRFNMDFSGDLELSYLKLTPSKTFRTLSVDMVVRDLIYNKTFPVSTEVSK